MQLHLKTKKKSITNKNVYTFIVSMTLPLLTLFISLCTFEYPSSVLSFQLLGLLKHFSQAKPANDQSPFLPGGVPFVLGEHRGLTLSHPKSPTAW